MSEEIGQHRVKPEMTWVLRGLTIPLRRHFTRVVLATPSGTINSDSYQSEHFSNWDGHRFCPNDLWCYNRSWRRRSSLGWETKQLPPDNDVIFWVPLKLDLVPWINSGHGNGGNNNNNHNKNGVTVILGTWNGIGSPLLSKSQTCLQLNVWTRPFSWIDQTVIVLNIANLCYPVQWAPFLTSPEAETAASNSVPTR